MGVHRCSLQKHLFHVFDIPTISSLFNVFFSAMMYVYRDDYNLYGCALINGRHNYMLRSVCDYLIVVYIFISIIINATLVDSSYVCITNHVIFSC